MSVKDSRTPNLEVVYPKPLVKSGSVDAISAPVDN